MAITRLSLTGGIQQATPSTWFLLKVNTRGLLAKVRRTFTILIGTPLS